MSNNIDLAAPTQKNEPKPLDDAPAKGSNKSIFIMLPVLLLIAVGSGLYFSGTLDKFLGKDTAEEGVETKQETVIDEAELEKINKIAFLPITDMIVNLSSNDGEPHLLRLSLQLELENEADMEIVKSVLPRIKDQFQTYLRELRVEDLRGSKGIYRLQIELLSRVNTAAYPVKVKDVLFDEIIVQ